MNEKLAEVQDVFLDKINHLCTRFGLNNIMAQLYTVLYFNNEPLSLDDMVERLKISKGSVSINVRALENYGAARRVWIKGSRKDYYEAEMDVSKVILDRVKSMAEKRLLEVEDMIKSSYEVLDSTNASDREEKEGIRIFRQRLGKIKDLYNHAQSLFDLSNSSLAEKILTRGTKR